MEGKTNSNTPEDPTSQESLIGANWPSLPIPADSPKTTQEITQDSPIQPAQKSPTPWKGQQKGPADYERDRVEKYAKYFKGNEILPIPELVEKLTPRTLSLVVSDLKTKKLVGLKRETFEELVKKAGIPCQYFCRKSFATWDVLLPTEDQAAKLAANNISTKYFRLQPEYRGTRRLRVTICNVPAHITGEVLAAYLSSYGQVEDFNLLRSPAGIMYGVRGLCLPAVPDEGWLQSHPRDSNQWGPADDYDGGGAETKVLVVQTDWPHLEVLSRETRKFNSSCSSSSSNSSNNNNSFKNSQHHHHSSGPRPGSGPAQNKWPRGPQTPTTAKTTTTTPVPPVSPTLSKKKKKKPNKEDSV